MDVFDLSPLFHSAIEGGERSIVFQKAPHSSPLCGSLPLIRNQVRIRYSQPWGLMTEFPHCNHLHQQLLTHEQILLNTIEILKNISQSSSSALLFRSYGQHITIYTHALTHYWHWNRNSQNQNSKARNCTGCMCEVTKIAKMTTNMPKQMVACPKSLYYKCCCTPAFAEMAVASICCMLESFQFQLHSTVV